VVNCELPGRCFEDRSREFLKFVEFLRFYLFLVVTVAADFLVFVELLGSQR